MKTNPAFRLLLKLLACFALLACGSAQATITCSLTSNGFSSTYYPASLSTNVTAASVTITCTRSNKNDNMSRTFTITANNGLNSTGTQNRAMLSGVNYINYDIHSNSSCSSPWQGNTTLGGTVYFTSSTPNLPYSQTVNFWGCIPAGQNVAAGTYTDTVTMTPMNRRGTKSIGNPATFPVTITAPSSCSISKSPGPISFTYTSFQGATSASTSFEATCTSLLPYTMALDATSGALLGLNYTLSLSASSATGTGGAQTYTINGSIAAGQAGTCAGATCSATAPRTLTIGY